MSQQSSLYYADPTRSDYHAIMDAGWAEPADDYERQGARLEGGNTGAAPSGTDRLGPGQELRSGMRLTSQNGAYYLTLQNDGNLVLYKNGGGSLWDSATVGSGAQRALMQSDGNFVLYAGTRPAWNSGSQGHPGAYVVVQNDGNLVVYQAGRALWNSDTAGGVKHEHSGGGLFGSIGSAIGSVAKSAYGLASQGEHLLQEGTKALTNNPLWDIARTGVSFIPGVGNAVSAGMAGAAALGRGESLANIALSAAKGALPGGALTAAAFDIATGLAKGKNVTDAILQAARAQVPGGDIGKAAFDAATAIAQGHALSDVAINAIRAKVPGGAAGQAAFNTAIQAFRSQNPQAAKPPTYPSLSLPQNMVAQAIHVSPALQKAPVRAVAADLSSDIANVKSAIAAIMNRLQGSQIFNSGDVGAMDSLDACCEREGVPRLLSNANNTGAWFDLYGRYPTSARVPMNAPMLQAMMARVQGPARQGILAHGLLPRMYHYSGELDQKGGWIIRSGDTGFGIAQKLTGSGNRWREILAANPGMTTYTAANGSTQIKPWAIGQRITIPTSWLGTAAPVVNPPIIGGGPSTTTTTTPVSTVSTPISNFPAASVANTLPMLRMGDGRANGKSASVMMWQSLLLKLGSTLVGSADGEFGPKTDAATRGYQTRMGLTVDGIVGPITWGAALQELAGKPAAPPVATPPIVIPTAPPAAPPIVVGPAIPSSTDVVKNAAIQAALAFFTQHHGADASGPSPAFGTVHDDSAGNWDARTTEAMRGFQQWNNAQPGRSSVPTDGNPDQASVNALMAQNASDLAGVGVSLPPLPTVPVIGPVPGSGVPRGAPPGNVPGAAPPKPPTKQAGSGDGVVVVAIAIAILAALASQKGSRGKAA
jgi:hypothetical protein